MHHHYSRYFLEHVRMLLQSLKALCKAPCGAGSIWKYIEALARATGVSGRFAYGFWTVIHFGDKLTTNTMQWGVLQPRDHHAATYWRNALLAKEYVLRSAVGAHRWVTPLISCGPTGTQDQWYELTPVKICLENLQCNRNWHLISLWPLCYSYFLYIMTANPVLWPLERSYENVMCILPYVILNYTMMQIAYTACIPSTPFFQSSSPPPPSPSPPSPSPLSPSPPSPSASAPSSSPCQQIVF